MSARLFSRYNVSQAFAKQTMTAVLSLVLLASSPLVFAVTRFKVNSVDYDPVSQAVLLRSTGPVDATVNSVNIGRNKRIIIDLEDAEIGSIPRDMLLFQQLAQKWPAIKNVTVNQFGGAHPVVRILVDVDGVNYSTQVLQNHTQQIGIRVQPLAVTVPVAQSNSSSPLLQMPGQPSQTMNNNSIQDLKKAIQNLNQRYEQLEQDNKQLRSQLQQQQSKQAAITTKPSTPKTATPDTHVKEIQTLREQSSALQTQVNQLKLAKEALLKRVTQTVPAKPTTPTTTTANPTAGEITRLKNELATSMERTSTLQTQNNQLTKQVQQLQQEKQAVKAAPLSSATTASITASDLQLQDIKKQLEQAKGALNRSITTINEQNKEMAFLKRQVEQMQGVADANARDQLTALNTKLEQKENELKALKTEHDALTQKLQENSANPSAAEVAALKSELQSNQTQLNVLKSKLTATESQLQSKQQALETAQASLSKKEPMPTSVSGANKEIASLRQALNTSRQDALRLQETMNSLTKQQDDLKQNEQALTEKVLSLQKERDSAVEKATQLSEENTKLTATTKLATTEKIEKTTSGNNQVKTLTAQVESLKQDKSKLKSVNEALFAELTTLKAKTSENKPAGSDRNAQVTTLNNQVSNLEAQINDLMLDKRALSEELEKFKAANEAKSKEIASSSNAITSTPEDPKIAALNNAMLKKQLAESQAKTNETEARYRKILAEYDRTQKQLKLLMAANPKAGTNSSVSDNNKADMLVADNKRLQTEVDSLTQEVQGLRAKALDLQKQVIHGDDVTSLSNASKKPDINKTAEAEKLFNLAVGYDESNQKTQAMESYRKAVQLDPKNYRYVIGLASNMASQQQYPQAVQLLQDYIDNNAYQADVFNTLGKVYLMNGQADEARAAFAKAVPHSALSNYGSALKKQGKLAEAEQVFKLVLTMVPNDSEALFNLGNIYNAQNNLQGAKENYAQALTINPSFAEAHYNLGLVYSKLGDKTNAAQHLEKFLELSPNASNADVIKTYVKKLKS